MFSLLADENFNHRIVEALPSGVRVLTVVDAGLRGADDPAVLDWAAANGCIVLTHDFRTMPAHAWERVQAGLPMPGVLMLDSMLAVGEAVAELTLLLECSEAAEWANHVVYLPLK